MYSLPRRAVLWPWVERPTRRARRFRRPGHFRRVVTRVLANLSLGILLVGCSGVGSGKSLAFWHKPQPPIDVLQHGIEPGARIDAYHRLGSMAEKMPESERKEALELLAKGISTEPSPLARCAAVGALAHFHEPEAVEALERAAGDTSPMVRAEVCKVFGERKSEASIAIVGRLANYDADLDVRTAATLALVEIHSPRCNPHLLECLNDKGVGVSTLAAQGLKENTDVNLGRNYDAWASYLKDGKIPPGTSQVAEESFFRKMFR